jgi:hypothetical protein
VPVVDRDGTRRVVVLNKPQELRDHLLSAVLSASRDGILALRAKRDGTAGSSTARSSPPRPRRRDLPPALRRADRRLPPRHLPRLKGLGYGTSTSGSWTSAGPSSSRPATPATGSTGTFASPPFPR